MRQRPSLTLWHLPKCHVSGLLFPPLQLKAHRSHCDLGQNKLEIIIKNKRNREMKDAGWQAHPDNSAKASGCTAHSWEQSRGDGRASATRENQLWKVKKKKIVKEKILGNTSQRRINDLLCSPFYILTGCTETPRFDRLRILPLIALRVLKCNKISLNKFPCVICLFYKQDGQPSNLSCSYAAVADLGTRPASPAVLRSTALAPHFHDNLVKCCFLYHHLH